MSQYSAATIVGARLQRRFSAGIILLLLSAPVMIGLLMLNATILEPRRKANRAQWWVEVPCTVRRISMAPVFYRSRVRGEIIEGHLPRVSFEYEFGSAIYTSNRFWFGSVPWRVSDDLRNVIAPYQLSEQATCLVNPHKPTEAVLTRQLYERPSLVWIWLISLACVSGVLVGLFIQVLRPVLDDLRPQHLSFREERRWLSVLTWNSIAAGLFYALWIGKSPFAYVVFFWAVLWIMGLFQLAKAISRQCYF